MRQQILLSILLTIIIFKISSMRLSYWEIFQPMGGWNIKDTLKVFKYFKNKQKSVRSNAFDM